LVIGECLASILKQLWQVMCASWVKNCTSSKDRAMVLDPIRDALA